MVGQAVQLQVRQLELKQLEPEPDFEGGRNGFSRKIGREQKLTNAWTKYVWQSVKTMWIHFFFDM